MNPYAKFVVEVAIRAAIGTVVAIAINKALIAITEKKK